MQHLEPVPPRLFELTEPISMVNFASPEPNDSMAALGFRTYWDGDFAGRSAPLGRGPAGGTRGPAGRGPGGVGARPLHHLRGGWGAPPHPEGLGDDHTRGGARGTS